MKACGISVYRVALPMIVSALAAAAVLLALEETILGPANRRAEALRHVIRGGSPQTFDVLLRRWLVGSDGTIYHYDFYDTSARGLNGLSVYEFGAGFPVLTRRTYAERARHVGATPAEDAWQLERGWTRELTSEGETRSFTTFTERRASIEPIEVFAAEQPDERFMSYSQLRGHTSRLRTSGLDVRPQLVALERKLSFPFVTIILTLLAVPFALTTGRRGAMYGVGLGIVLALSYWVSASVFAALGTGGLVSPLLAAWAPNLLFTAGAGYLLLTVRT
jgi:lipopolysaccharide export LptBFGC system permease protein LptF